MSHQYGVDTLYYSNLDIKDTEATIDLVIVGPLTSTDGVEVNEARTAIDWPHNSFLRDYPKGRALTFQKCLQSNEGICSAVKRLGGVLVEVLDDFRQSTKVPFVVCCQGLGGFVYLKALEISESGKWNETLTQATKCALFLGTPLNDENFDNFRSALRACTTIESGLVNRKAAKIGVEDAQMIQSLLSVLKKQSFPIATFAERTPVSYRTRFLMKRSRVIVDRQMSFVKGCSRHDIPVDHQSIGSLDVETYREVSRFISTSVPVKESITTVEGAIKKPSRQPLPDTQSTIHTDQHLSTSLGSSLVLDEAKRNVSSNVQLEATKKRGSKTNMTKCHHIPFPKNQFFRGRQDVLEVMQAHLVTSQDSSTTPRAFALWGVPGQGKTQTALRFAFDNEGYFPYIFWITADREEKFLQGLHDCAVAVGLREPATDVTAGAKKFMEFLSTITDNWLLVFDNATNHQLINEWWPHGKKGAILITARKHVFATSSVANAGIELEKLPDEIAVEMILDQVPSTSRNGDFDEQEEALRIVKRVSGLGLGIQAAIGLINESNCSLKRYNAKYTDARAVLRETSAEQVHRNFAPYPKGLYEVLTEALENLTQDARMLIEMFALLDPDRIQEGLLDIAAETEGLKGIGFVQNQMRCINSLMNGLIAKNSHEAHQRSPSFHIHRLLQQCVIMDMTERSRQQAFDVAATIISSAIGPEPTLESAVLQFREYFPHAQSLHDFFRQNMKKEGSSESSILLQFIQLLRKAAAICYRRGYFNTGLDFVKTGQDILGEDPRTASTSGHWSEKVVEAMRLHYYHACIATEVGDFKLSLHHFKHAHSCFNKVTSEGCTGPTQRELRNYIGGIANSLNGLGYNNEAEGYYLKSLKLGDPDDIESPYEVNLCRCRWAAGRFEEAGKRLCELIELREKVYKQKNDIRNYLMGHMLYVLGNVRISQDRHDEAYLLHIRARDCWIHTYGEEHHKTGDAWHKCGWHETRLHQFENARESFRKALGVYMSGTDQKFRQGEIARSNFQLARVLKELGDEDSNKCLQIAERLRKDLLGDDYTPQANEEVYDNLSQRTPFGLLNKKHAATVRPIGANRGIGLELAQTFHDNHWTVHVSVRPQSRNDASIKDLEVAGVKIFEIDYLNEATIIKAAREYGSDALDCLVNCAGRAQSFGGPLEWQGYNNEILTNNFQVMVVGPLLVTKHFQANLEKSKAGKLVKISSSLGSISGTFKGNKIAYRVAKAGLNQETRTIAMSLKDSGSNIVAMAIDPGAVAVATRLSNWNGRIDIKESVNGIYSVIHHVSLKKTGKFWRWNGEELQF